MKLLVGDTDLPKVNVFGPFSTEYARTCPIEFKALFSAPPALKAGLSSSEKNCAPKTAILEGADRKGLRCDADLTRHRQRLQHLIARRYGLTLPMAEAVIGLAGIGGQHG